MTQEDIKTIIDEAAEFKMSDSVCFQYLATLSDVDYDRKRKEEAKKLGISVSTLDKEVKKHRSECSAQVETEIPDFFPLIELWDTSVNAEELLLEITTLLNKCAVLPPHADTAIALWIVFTWCIDHVETAPILTLSSPEKRCGKTTVLSILGKLVLKPLPASNITTAALFRAVELWKPTLLIDEADTFISSSDELRGVINSGHTRSTAYVLRITGEDHTPTCFMTWGAKVIALIGKLPETIHDRSIVIELRRKRSEEKIERMRDTDPQIFHNLTRKLKRWSQDYAVLLKTIRPHVPKELSDRAADNWEPLLGIAEFAGAEWIKKAYQAAMFLSNQEKDSIAVSTQLLSDIKQTFDKTEHLEKISTRELIKELCADEELAWATYDKGKPIIPKQLASLLKIYGIQSKNIRDENQSVCRGFEQNQFKDAWGRYLSLDTSKNAATTLQNSQIVCEIKASEGFSSVDQSATHAHLETISATLSSQQNCGSNGSCSVVADNLGGGEENNNQEVFFSDEDWQDQDREEMII